MTKNEKHLLVSLYDWSVQATGREIDQKCETLLRLKNSSAKAYAEFIAAAGPKAPSCGIALVKRLHLSAVKLKGEEFTIEEQRIVDDFINYARFKRFAAKNPVPVTGAREGTRKSSLAKDLRAHLDPLLGRAELLAGGIWKYEIVAGSFRIATYVDLGARLPLRYSHKIIARDGRMVCETSLLHWHGIATETAWDSMGSKDVADAVKLLGELCGRFLTAVESICRDPRTPTGAAAPSSC